MAGRGGFKALECVAEGRLRAVHAWEAPMHTSWAFIAGHAASATGVCPIILDDLPISVLLSVPQIDQRGAHRCSCVRTQLAGFCRAVARRAGHFRSEKVAAIEKRLRTDSVAYIEYMWLVACWEAAKNGEPAPSKPASLQGGDGETDEPQTVLNFTQTTELQGKMSYGVFWPKD